MRINISEILANPSVKREYEVQPDFTELKLTHSSYPVSDKESFLLTVSQVSGKLQIKGETAIKLIMPCDRCLDDVEISFPIGIDIRVDPDQFQDVLSEDETEVNEIRDIDEFSFMDGYLLDVDKLVSDEVVVALPTKVLCREDCKGLCSICGTNLNHSSCSCDRSVGDPRMAAIRDIFKEFNS